MDALVILDGGRQRLKTEPVGSGQGAAGREQAAHLFRRPVEVGLRAYLFAIGRYTGTSASIRHGCTPDE
jgi:hypothetical protein